MTFAKVLFVDSKITPWPCEHFNYLTIEARLVTFGVEVNHKASHNI